MTQDSCLTAEFSENLPTLLKLRSENADVDDICTDLELLGQELAQFSKPERQRYRRGYLDAKESYLALRQELTKILQSNAEVKAV
ncbi:MAG: hypothetical protein ACU0CA_18060 [Paracoccaceae bacterium]